jgi:cysteine desulfurase
VFNDGGAQENGRRGGTENVAGIVGLATALQLAANELESEADRMRNLQTKLIDGLLATIPDSRLNGSRTSRVPGNVNISFKFIEGEGMLLHLDMLGVCASSGSACTSGSLDPSHVLMAMGLSHEQAHGSLRMTLGRGTTDEHVDYVLETLPAIVNKRRAMSPLWEDYQKKAGEK